jgi:hypothetical protein
MTEVGPAGHKRPGNRRAELERLIDRTVLGPTHPELGTCWQFTGTTTPYGRIASCLHRRCLNPDHLASREHEPEPKPSRRQELSQDSLPAWTSVRRGEHADDAAWRSSLPCLQPRCAATVGLSRPNG